MATHFYLQSLCPPCTAPSCGRRAIVELCDAQGLPVHNGVYCYLHGLQALEQRNGVQRPPVGDGAKVVTMVSKCTPVLLHPVFEEEPTL